MNKNIFSNRTGTAVVILLSFLLFYFPTVINLLFSHHGPPGMDGINLLLATVYTLIFCLNYFLIIPKTLFGHGRKWWFYLINMLLILSCLCILPLWIHFNGAPEGPHGINDHQGIMEYLRFSLRDSVMMVLSVALAYALQFSRERERLQRRELELDYERRQIELRGLKMQLNPHFLFNTLNNIYALINISPERAGEALHDLSGMLRYMIYDASSSGVPIEKEICFIEDYVRLMILRITSSTRISCNVENNYPGNLLITPLLFLTLVENAFKHFATTEDGGFIDISIKVDQERVICQVKNTYDVTSSSTKDTSGVGLKNVCRQLDLLYRGLSSLKISRDGGVHTAILSIDSSALHNCKADSK